MRTYGVGILGAGHSLGARVENNEELCRLLRPEDQVTPQWIVEKTGIHRRFLAGPEEQASDFCLRAARQALAAARVEARQLRAIVVATFSGEYIFPPLSAKIQRELGASEAQIYDLQANCSGFVTALTTASDRMLVDESVAYSLVIGVELHTRFIDRSDVNTAIYFSDGAGAAVLGQVEAGQGIQASAFFTDSSNYEAVRLRGGGSAQPYAGRIFDPTCDYIEQNGLATWKQAITHLPPTIRRVCQRAGVQLEQVDWFLFHQANLNLIHYVVRKLKRNLEQTYTNVERIGNTGAASVGIVLSEALATGKILEGQIVVLAAVGAGFNFAASLWKWSAGPPPSGGESRPGAEKTL